MHWPGIEPGSPAWEARILPLNHQCPEVLGWTRSPQKVAQEGFFFFLEQASSVEGQRKTEGKKQTKKNNWLVRHSLLLILDINFGARRMRVYKKRLSRSGLDNRVAGGEGKHTR